MVQAVINIDEETNRLLNIVKAKYGLKDKSDAINLVTQEYGSLILEPALRPEYEKRLKRIKKGKFVKVNDFAKRYGLEK